MTRQRQQRRPTSGKRASGATEAVSTAVQAVQTTDEAVYIASMPYIAEECERLRRLAIQLAEDAQLIECGLCAGAAIDVRQAYDYVYQAYTKIARHGERFDIGADDGKAPS